MKVNSNIGNNTALTGKAVRNTSFRGFWNKVGTVNKNLMEHVEKGGFFAEFCIMDMCGMVLPRIYAGLHRNEKELGRLNYEAGAEEALREGITGPSMFLIPIGAVILAGRRLGKATAINSKLLSKFSDIFKNLGSQFASKENSTTCNAFASRIFDSFIANNEAIQRPAVDAAIQPLNRLKIEFVQKLTSNVGTKMSGKDSKAAISAFEDLIANINTSYFGSREYTLGLSTGKGKDAVHTTARDLYLDARKYMEDVIPSARLSFDAIKAKGTEITKEIFENTVASITKIRENGRRLLCLGGSAALAGFLCMIPKIYQLSKKNPALNGMENDKGGKQ
ncbi:MAG: hypothetical protein K6A44_04650 [bacterium]|nr:hypothetical protein [bacterium]